MTGTLQNTNQLRELHVRATDGQVGSVDTAYFDDDRWTIRYVVVDTGGWLGHKVLISPIAVKTIDWAEGTLDTTLNRDQIRRSPDVDTEPPVSRHHERRYHTYYGFPYYWVGPEVWGSSAYPGALAAMPSAQQSREDARNSHLRSAKAIKGYRVAATNGEAGHVEGLVFDDETWTIEYLEVLAGNWISGKLVLIPPSWIRTISWEDRRVHVSVDREAVDNSPVYEVDKFARGGAGALSRLAPGRR